MCITELFKLISVSFTTTLVLLHCELQCVHSINTVYAPLPLTLWHPKMCYKVLATRAVTLTFLISCATLATVARSTWIYLLNTLHYFMKVYLMLKVYIRKCKQRELFHNLRRSYRATFAFCRVTTRT